MTVRFDPTPPPVSPAERASAPETGGGAKANSLSQPIQNQEPKGETFDPYNPFPDGPETVSEMETLFSGLRRIKNLQAEHPIDPIDVPDLENDLLEPLPQLGSSSISISAIVDRYKLLQNNLLDRRNNYSLAMEGYLKPEEAFDLYGRIDEIDRALKKVDKNLEKAYQLQAEFDARGLERDAAEARRQAEELAAARTREAQNNRFERQPDGSYRKTEGMDTQILRPVHIPEESDEGSGE